MLDIGSTQRDHALIGAWVGTGIVNLVIMSMVPGEETIPFHLIWIGLALVYGYTDWSLRGMLGALLAVAVSTGYVLARNAALGAIGWAETTEVPLMAGVFVVMAWHVRRRHHALAETARLAELDRRRAETRQMFVRLASHELRTPITVARGYTELIRTAHGDPGTVEDSAIVLEELDKLARITQRLVTIMQTDDEGTRVPTDVDAELSRIVRRWEPTADRVWSVHSTVGIAPTRPDRLETALDCLLENAVKFTAPGDRIAVTGGMADQTWTVRVSDTGRGVTAAEAAELNEGRMPWPSRTGTGLGLCIARSVAESWGGRLRVAARPGGGTEVTLSMPYTPARPDAPAILAPVAPPLVAEPALMAPPPAAGPPLVTAPLVAASAGSGLGGAPAAASPLAATPAGIPTSRGTPTELPANRTSSADRHPSDAPVAPST